jgi:hypothetical protein
VNHRFDRFAVVDWSGAKGRSHAGIALAICRPGVEAPSLVMPKRRFWSREELADWVLSQTDRMLIGFDFSFAPPFVGRGSYLPGESVPSNAKDFWHHVDVQCDDEDLGAASLLERHYRRHFYLGAADGRKADFMHFRVCEARYNAAGGGKPSTVYDAIGAAQVAKASFSGMRMLHKLNTRHAIWPFDPVPDSGPVIVEIYTQIAARSAGVPKGRSKVRDANGLDRALARLGSEPHTALSHYSDHATDAILTAAWLRANGHRAALWIPEGLTPDVAQTEGWTFGIN